MKRRAVWALLLLGGGLILAGCGVISAVIDTEQALRDAGYQSVSVSVSPTSGNNSVRASVKVAAAPTASTALNVASVVWAKFHERFDFVHVTVHGEGPSVVESYSYDQLQAQFGPRNPAWDRRSVASATTQVGVEVLIGIAVVGGAVVAVVVLGSRRKKRRRPPGPPWSPGPDSPPWGQPAAPWGHPGQAQPWGQPNPPPPWAQPGPPWAPPAQPGPPQWAPPAHPPAGSPAPAPWGAPAPEGGGGPQPIEPPPREQ